MDFVYIKYDFTEPLLEGVKKEDYYDVIVDYWDGYVAEGPFWHYYSEEGKSITVAYRKKVVFDLGLPMMYDNLSYFLKNGDYKRARILITDLLKLVDPEREDVITKLVDMLKEAEEKLGCPKTKLKESMLVFPLKAKLKSINRDVTEETIVGEFEKIATSLLYGGYINVHDRFHIYVRTAEFYYHEEEGSIKDPIVYHRNKERDLNGNPPYFPPMMLHAHSSGFDITFEDEKRQVRSSALIRAYEVYDVKQKCLWCWEMNGEAGHFVERKVKDLSSQKRAYNTQCTYLKTFLNGFALNSDDRITWVDRLFAQNVNISSTVRQGIMNSKYAEFYRNNGLDKRKWAFKREEDLNWK